MPTIDPAGIATLIGSVINTLFLLLGIWGLWSFWPQRVERGHANHGAYTLITAIWLGFLGAVLNVLYWRVLGDQVARHTPEYWEAYREFGNTYGDIVWKGLGAFAIWQHFYARYMSIPEDERDDWHPLTMGGYPDRTMLSNRMLSSIRSRSLRRKRR
jgi:hypothetical protein